MSRAFVKEQDVDNLEELPERPISEHPNNVTEAGLAQIEGALAKASEAYTVAQASADRAALAAASIPRSANCLTNLRHMPRVCLINLMRRA